MGPFTDEQFRDLIANGAIQPATLVWQQKLTSWMPLAQVPSELLPAAPAASAAPPVGDAPPVSATLRCSNCGGSFPPDNLVQIENALVCPACKPIVLQRIKEGFDPLRTAVTPEQLVHRISSENRTISVGRCYSSAWELYKANFWPMLGVTLLVFLVMGVGGAIPFIGSCISLVISGPLIGGLYLYYLKQIRGQPASAGDGFSGFTNNFGQLFLGYLVPALLAYLSLLPAALYFFIRIGMNDGEPPTDAIVVGSVLGGFGLLVTIFLTVAWMFTLPLIVDRKLSFWPAMGVSRLAVTKRFGSMFLLLLAGMGISILGLMACIIGVVFVVPLVFTAFVIAYEDLFGERPLSPATAPTNA